MDSTEEAIAIGQIIGKSVIVMSCSTGSTLSAILAARNPGSIQSKIMYSPNIDIKDGKLDILSYPWGYQIAKMNLGREVLTIPYPPDRINYWNDAYHIKGLVSLKTLINQTMTKETFKGIDQPLYIGYYYRDEINQDQVVSILRMYDFFNQVSTPPGQKKMIAFPDAKRHVITSYMTS